MKTLFMYEWGILAIGDAPGAVPRICVKQLLAVARRAQSRLRTGGFNDGAILMERDGMLRAGPVVGLIATSTVSLEILPKINETSSTAARRNLVRMLAIAAGLRVSEGDLGGLGIQHFDLLEIFISLFCKKIFAQALRGLPRRYVTKEDDLKALRGKIDLKRQCSSLVTSPQIIACQFDDLSADIRLNHIVKASIRIMRNVSRSADNQRSLLELEYMLADVATVSPRQLKFDDTQLDRTNTKWHEVFRIAQLIVGDRFQNTSSGGESGFALLFVMNDLFEKFIGIMLRRAFRHSNLSVSLQGPHRFALRHRNNMLYFMTKPDIVISSGDQPLAIIDTKWKTIRDLKSDSQHGVAQADVYQMITYAQLYAVKELMLLYPHNGGMNRRGIQSVYNVNGASDIRFSVATIDLGEFSSINSQLSGMCREVLKSYHVA
jgi:5-methylcytosine-specific restriction enzyme subunit McrC